MEKSISQIATTIEQSRRLILAGVSPDSADMYWIGSGATISPEEDDYKLVAEPYRPQNERMNDLRAKAVADRDKYGFDTSADIAFINDILVRTIPAWSLSRLLDIMKSPLVFPHPTSSTELMTILVADISAMK